MDEEGYQEPHLLVVDDDEASRNLYTEILQAEGYKCFKAANANEAISILNETKIDLMLTDIVMPGLSGLDLMKKIREISDAHVIAFTGFIKDYDFQMVIQSGAHDFMLKPVHRQELLTRVKRVLRERLFIEQRNAAYKNLEAANQQLLRYADDLNQNFQELKFALQNLQKAYLEAIHRLVIAAEFKDEDTAEHIVRMSRYCTVIAERLGLARGETQNILYASPMHDVGKIGIPDSILMKPGKLSEQEWEIMKKHVIIGEKILANSEAEVIKMGAQIAISHHEKWNGQGYPKGLSGKQIPLCGRISAVADVFDALTSQRPYKKAMPLEKTLDIMKEGRGSHFDPDIIDVFLENMDDILRIKGEVDKAA
ncbi:MAG: response regulator [Desulfobacteraceae bacterium]|nr:MAG: response regulator [Desulfobacteraceae bacterium]